MKRYTRNLPVVMDVEIIGYHPLLEFLETHNIAASIDLSEFELPSGQVISKEKERVTQEIKDDSEAFMDRVEFLCGDKLHLFGTYKNVSEDDSYYYNYFAKDSNDNIILDYRMRLRISSHNPKRSKQQKLHKKSELDSETLRRLLSEEEIQGLDAYSVYITVNDKTFTSYEQAFAFIVSRLQKAVQVMHSREKYRSKKPISEDMK